MSTLQHIWDGISGNLAEFALHLLIGIAILIVTHQLAKRSAGWLERTGISKHMDPSVHSFLITSLALVLRIVGMVSAALVIGVPESALITLFGSAGVALGLALQGSLSNLAGGLILVFFRPFGIGDYIRSGEHEGTVAQISAFYTTILTPDNRRMVLPNGALTNAPIVNFSAEGKRMLELPFSVAYAADAAQTRKVILDVALNDPAVLQEPAPQVPMTSLDDSAVVFTLRAWVSCAELLPTKFRLIENVKLALDAAGIEIPYPQLDVHQK